MWVERRQPPAAAPADSTFASLSIATSRDSLARLPAGSVISLVIAGPAGSTPPDTVRLLTAEEPDGGPLWRGSELRPGEYTAQLTTPGYAAGPRTFRLNPGERAELEVRLHRTSTCDTASAAAPR